MLLSIICLFSLIWLLLLLFHLRLLLFSYLRQRLGQRSIEHGDFTRCHGGGMGGRAAQQLPTIPEVRMKDERIRRRAVD